MNDHDSSLQLVYSFMHPRLYHEVKSLFEKWISFEKEVNFLPPLNLILAFPVLSFHWPEKNDVHDWQLKQRFQNRNMSRLTTDGGRQTVFEVKRLMMAMVMIIVWYPFSFLRTNSLPSLPLMIKMMGSLTVGGNCEGKESPLTLLRTWEMDNRWQEKETVGEKKRKGVESSLLKKCICHEFDGTVWMERKRQEVVGFNHMELTWSWESLPERFVWRDTDLVDRPFLTETVSSVKKAWNSVCLFLSQQKTYVRDLSLCLPVMFSFKKMTQICCCWRTYVLLIDHYITVRGYGGRIRQKVKKERQERLSMMVIETFSFLEPYLLFDGP